MPVAVRGEARVREFPPLSRFLCPTKAKDCLDLDSSQNSQCFKCADLLLYNTFHTWGLI